MKKKTKLKTALCENCRFWLHIENDSGSCRRFPPSVIHEEHIALQMEWPDTKGYEWCGEFKPGGPKY